ncbi:MAG: uroporphyrinogen-III synthase [Planctomycetota bacterium]|jgi:uroporphyrinogen-III synthase|nr:uroporphyrinogen-III synthase [Planctomycetota bacterium]
MDRPLTGKRVVITRAPEQAGELAALLASRGAELYFFPLLRIDPPADSGPLDAALGALPGFDLAVFTSRNAVERSCARARALAVDGWPPVACVGPGTAQAAREQGLRVALVPEQADADGLVAALTEQTAQRALLPQAHNARPVVLDGLRAAGWDCVAVEAYRGVSTEPGALPERTSIDAITFASSATVERFVAAVGAEAWRRLKADGCAWISIGRRTTETLKTHGAYTVITATEATMASLADAVVASQLG